MAGETGYDEIYIKKAASFQIIAETEMCNLDTLNLIVEGGKVICPRPFGTGVCKIESLCYPPPFRNRRKRILQLLVACRERANEVVEILQNFSELRGPAYRTQIDGAYHYASNISNDAGSSACEASEDTAMSLAEYYRSMGLKV